ncbi:MAG: hypothetical protein ACK5Q5_21595 [Planctomycetaceae bacterium]
MQLFLLAPKFRSSGTCLAPKVGFAGQKVDFDLFWRAEVRQHSDGLLPAPPAAG